MPVYSYRAEHKEDRVVVRGTISSESASLARKELREQGLAVLAIDEVKSRINSPPTQTNNKTLDGQPADQSRQQSIALPSKLSYGSFAVSSRLFGEIQFSNPIRLVLIYDCEIKFGSPILLVNWPLYWGSAFRLSNRSTH